MKAEHHQLGVDRLRTEIAVAVYIYPLFDRDVKFITNVWWYPYYTQFYQAIRESHGRH